MGFRAKLHSILADVLDPSSQDVHRPEQLVLLRGALQSIPDNTFTKINFDAVGVDTVDMWQVGTPSRIFIKRDGFYLCAGFVAFAPNATGFREVIVSEFNDADGAIGDYGRAVIPGSVVISTAVPFIMFRSLLINPGFHYGIRVRQNSGAALDVELVRLSFMRLSHFIA